MNLAISRVLIWKMSKIFSLENRGAVCDFMQKASEFTFLSSKTSLDVTEIMKT